VYACTQSGLSFGDLAVQKLSLTSGLLESYPSTMIGATDVT
jgi:hypothetical protein